MSPLTTFRIALASLGANKLRAGLTLLGIVIGVAAVISLMAIGRGVQETITSRIQTLGTNLLFVRPGGVSQGGVSQGQGSAATLTLEDAYALVDPGIRSFGIRRRAGATHLGSGGGRKKQHVHTGGGGDSPVRTCPQLSRKLR